MTEQRATELKQLVAVLDRTVKTREALASDDALNLVEVVPTMPTPSILWISTITNSWLWSKPPEKQSFMPPKRGMKAIEKLNYPPVEEKATMLLNLVTKNYSFSDGSRTEEKDVKVKVVVYLINRNN